MTGAARILVTGSSGYLGRQVVEALAGQHDEWPELVVGMDLREPFRDRHLPGVIFAQGDIRHTDLEGLLRAHRINQVVHLAAIVTPPQGSDHKLQYEVDVVGARRLLEACVAAGVEQVLISSSGAAYGYHTDNPDWLKESDPVRGNEEFAYAWHKRLVEEKLAEYREHHPALKQTVLRVGTILGARVNNQITALFEKNRILVLSGAASPFVFIWDQDVVGIILHALRGGHAGIYNVAGDGALGLRELAARMGKSCLVVPPFVLQAALAIGHRLGLTRYGPEQLRFLRYRPVLNNRHLKEALGYRPRKTSAEVFDLWWASRARSRDAEAGPWRGQCAIVTGAGGGLGAALSRQLARAGAHVALLDRNGAAAQAVAETLRAAGHQAQAFACDVCDAEQVERTFAQVVAEFGGIDLLVNNAGISSRCLFEHSGTEVVRRVMEVNYLGAVHCTKAAMTALVAAHGRIVAVSSIAGFSPLIGRTAYAASKHALHGFFDSLRSELRDRGVSVTLACPSFIATGIEAAAIGGDGQPAGRKRDVAGSVASPDAIAACILQAACKRKPLLLPGAMAKAAYTLSRFAPRLYETLMHRRVGTEFR
uniref:SDR family oxidoreductase n=1 Tax=Cupriavidus necator TaxID=106590 RepID=UPI003F49317C